MDHYIGCDLGGTNIKAGVVDLKSGSVMTSSSTPTLAKEGPEAVMERMIDLIRTLIENSGIDKDQLQGLGISAPGVLDPERGKTLFLPNFPGKWRDIPLGRTLSNALRLPVSILNDVRAITYGEYKFGAGRGVDRLACYAIGTGVGGGLIINGRLVLGFQGTAGELGHQTVEMDGLRCGCGNYGCLEAYASGPAIASRAEKAVRQGLTTKLGELVDYDLNKLSPKVVAQAARMGDAIAREIWDEVGRYLGTGIANVCVSIGPERVVLAGGVAEAGDLLLKPIRTTLHERVHVMPIDKVDVVLSSLGSEAGILGMASWAAAKQHPIQPS